MTLSIIIPVFNEQENIAQVLKNLESVPDIEIIVVDGGSQDDTVAIAQSLNINSLNIKVIVIPAGRAKQMNAGAAIASGDSLLFLHGDTCLPSGFETLIPEALSRPKVVAGAFELGISGTDWKLRIVEWMVKVRSHLFSLPYGDQAIFLSKQQFQNLGGFPELPIMEDFQLILKLQKQGKIHILPVKVTTSGRRWQKLGIVQTTCINQLMILGYFLGIPIEKLAQFYRQQKRFLSLP